MPKINSSEVGKAVKIRLIEMDKTQEWLIDCVAKRTGLYFDSSYLWKICNGVLKPPKIIQAICEVLDIEYSVSDQQSDKTDNSE